GLATASELLPSVPAPSIHSVAPLIRLPGTSARVTAAGSRLPFSPAPRPWACPPRPAPRLSRRGSFSVPPPLASGREALRHRPLPPPPSHTPRPPVSLWSP